MWAGVESRPLNEGKILKKAETLWQKRTDWRLPKSCESAKKLFYFKKIVSKFSFKILKYRVWLRNKAQNLQPGIKLLV
jgi:hypothetical protein